MIRLNSLRLEIGYTDEDLKNAVRRRLRIHDKHPFSHELVRLSLDARKKDDIHYTCSVDVRIDNEREILKDKRIKNVSPSEPVIYNDPFDALTDEQKASLKDSRRPVVVGFGPAGMLAGYKLAKAGLHPLIIERGQDVDTRIADVTAFWQGGSLKPDSNVQFGEGGAGTFSDGKLNTMIHDRFGRITEFFRIFIECGADPSIRYINKPHIGTDRLTEIVRNIRKQIIACGGEVRFGTKLTGLDIKNGVLCGIIVNDSEYIECDSVVLALGHSARDTFEMLYRTGIEMEKKAFAMGVRIQHPQELIGRAQYGDAYRQLPAADYKLTYQASNGRGVYSFCMCPGGFVVNASSEEGRLAVNGMSNSDRSEATANSALVVNVREDDFGGDSPLSGMELQRRLEEAAYAEGHGRIPAQYYADFLADRASIISDGQTSGNTGDILFGGPQSDDTGTEPGNAHITNFPGEQGHTLPTPNTKGAYTGGNLKNVLPGYISESIEEAMPVFGRTIAGFDSPDALMIGLESRTSSPVRLTRDENTLEAVGIKGIYPCGEGAGYAGGITSAAVDGIRVYEAIIQNKRSFYV